MLPLFRTQDQYYRWANARLYAELEKLTPEQLAAPTAANFGSIIAIANHLVLADRIWCNRFTGQGEPMTTVDAVPYPALPDLSAARIVEEGRITAYLDALDPEDAGGILRYATTDGTPMAKPLSLCILHCLNHQTHHRGQIHGMVGAFGVKAADIDLLGFERETGTYATLTA